MLARPASAAAGRARSIWNCIFRSRTTGTPDSETRTGHRHRCVATPSTAPHSHSSTQRGLFGANSTNRHPCSRSGPPCPCHTAPSRRAHNALAPLPAGRRRPAPDAPPSVARGTISLAPLNAAVLPRLGQQGQDRRFPRCLGLYPWRAPLRRRPYTVCTVVSVSSAARRQLGAIFHALTGQKECQIIEGHRMPDHVPVGMAIPPKHPVASVIGFLQGSVRLPSLAGAAKNETLQASISRLGATRYPAWASSWSRSVNTSASRRRRMATTKASAVKK